MSDAAPTSTPDLPEGNVGSDVAQAIEDIQEENLVIVNDDTRTWEVTETVTKQYGADDDRESKRVVRLESGTEDVFALVLEEYPDHRYHAQLHVLETKNWYEEGQVYDVESVEILDTIIPWPVVRRSGGSDVFHRPDPFTAAYGEAMPACEGAHIGEPDDYRFVGIQKIYPAKRPCMDCFRRRVPREVERINCPECGRLIGSGLFHGNGVNGIEGVQIDCPDRKCEFNGVVPLDD